MRKYLFLLLLVPLGLVLAQPQQISAADNQTRINEIINYLSVDTNLDSLMTSLNSMISGVPYVEQVFPDGPYLVMIGSVQLEFYMRGGLVVEIGDGAYSNAKKALHVSFETIIRLMESANPVNDAFMALLTGEIVLAAIPQCTDDSACADNEVCIKNECLSALTITIAPIGYSAAEYDRFVHNAKEEVDIFVKAAPVATDRVRVHYVDTSICPNLACTDALTDCRNVTNDCVNSAGLLGFSDIIVGMTKGMLNFTYYGGWSMETCGMAAFNSYKQKTPIIVRSRRYQPTTRFIDYGSDDLLETAPRITCYGTLAHEIGHYYGLGNVWGVPLDSQDSWLRCYNHNAADCNASGKETDIMSSYAMPKDHYGPAAYEFLSSKPLSEFQSLPSGVCNIGGADTCPTGQVCVKGECENALSIVVVPIGYSNDDFEEFYREAKLELDLAADLLPGNVRAYYISPYMCPGLNCAVNTSNMVDDWSDCFAAVKNCTDRTGFTSKGDYFVGLAKNDLLDHWRRWMFTDCGYSNPYNSSVNNILIARQRDYVPAWTGWTREYNPLDIKGYVGKMIRVAPGIYCYGSVVHELGYLMGLRPFYKYTYGYANMTDLYKTTNVMHMDAWPRDHFSYADFNTLLTNAMSGYQ